MVGSLVFRRRLVKFLVFKAIASEACAFPWFACMWFGLVGLVAWFAFVCFAVLCLLACFALLCLLSLLYLLDLLCYETVCDAGLGRFQLVRLGLTPPGLVWLGGRLRGAFAWLVGYLVGWLVACLLG